MTRKEANKILPDKPLISKITPQALVMLLIGPPKWGKTAFGMSNPDAILLGFEEGSKFQRGYKISIDKWHEKNYDIWMDQDKVNHMTCLQAVDALEATDRYNMVILDTADMMAKMCMDYHCDKLGVEHPQDAGDYGKGWDVTLNSPMRKMILRILKTGRGVLMLTHTKLEIARFTSGERARKESTLPSGVKRFVESQADIIMHGELGRKRGGNRLRDRILVCEGDMDTLAGSRAGNIFPERYIVKPKDQWKQFCEFFSNPKAAELAEREYRKFAIKK